MSCLAKYESKINNHVKINELISLKIKAKRKHVKESLQENNHAK